jgi:chromosome transmission fidelity protein 18
LATELAPLVNCILSPQVNPVLVGGSGYPVASVRKDTEKKLVARAVSAMEATGVRFQKVRVEASSGAAGGSGWAFRMDPPLDAVCLFSTSAKPGVEPVRYAVRQVLDQECRKATALKQKEAREARMGALSAFAAAAAAVTVEDSARSVEVRPTRKVKRDFFGRLVIEKDNAKTGEVEDAGSLKKRRRLGGEEREGRDVDVWVSYNEGFSNAVKKGIRLDELMDGLI